jgi:hypothetical protein
MLPVDVTAVEQTISLPVEKTQAAISRFIDWLEQYGETSYDFQTIYASRLGQKAKALYYEKPRLGLVAVAPMVFCEAFLPLARSIFFKRQRFPIADAHFAIFWKSLRARGVRATAIIAGAIHSIG